MVTWWIHCGFKFSIHPFKFARQFLQERFEGLFTQDVKWTRQSDGPLDLLYFHFQCPIGLISTSWTKKIKCVCLITQKYEKFATITIDLQTFKYLNLITFCRLSSKFNSKLQALKPNLLQKNPDLPNENQPCFAWQFSIESYVVLSFCHKSAPCNAPLQVNFKLTL